MDVKKIRFIESIYDFKREFYLFSRNTCFFFIKIVFFCSELIMIIMRNNYIIFIVIVSPNILFVSKYYYAMMKQSYNSWKENKKWNKNSLQIKTIRKYLKNYIYFFKKERQKYNYLNKEIDKRFYKSSNLILIIKPTFLSFLNF